MKQLCKAFCLLFLLSLLPVCANAVTLEQAQPVMPNIDVYVHQNTHDLSTLTLEDITATLDGEPLTVEAFAPSEEGTYYVFMLDISASIPNHYLQSVCSVIRNLRSQLRPEDELALITFGEKVNVLLEGGESEEAVSKALGRVYPTDNTTCFYEAMTHLVETVAAKQGMRRVAVVVSDGVNDTNSETTQEELEAALREGGVAVYAMAVKTNAAMLEQFRSFITLTGGKLSTFSSETAQKTFDSLLFSTDQIWHLALRSSTNIADGSLRKLSVQFGELSSLEAELRPTQWVPDTEIPMLVSNEIDLAAKTVRLEFSEALTDMEKPESYTLHAPDGQTLTPQQVTTDGHSVTLQCDQLTEDPGWTLSIEGLTDISMEANPLAPITLALTRPISAAPSAPSNQPTQAELERQESQDQLLFTLVIAGIALALLAALWAFLSLRRKKAAAVGPIPGKAAGNGKNARTVSFFFEEAEQTEKKE